MLNIEFNALINYYHECVHYITSVLNDCGYTALTRSEHNDLIFTIFVNGKEICEVCVVNFISHVKNYDYGFEELDNIFHEIANIIVASY